jgi:hypothetical protein
MLVRIQTAPVAIVKCLGRLIGRLPDFSGKTLLPCNVAAWGQRAQKGFAMSQLFRAIPYMTAYADCHDYDDFLLDADSLPELSRSLYLYWTCLSVRELQDPWQYGEMEKSLGRAVGDLWNYFLRNKVSCITYLTNNSLGKVRVENENHTPLETVTVFNTSLFDDDLESWHRMEKADPNSPDWKKTGERFTRSAIASLVRQLCQHDEAVLDPILRRWREERPATRYYVHKLVVEPLTWTAVAARPDCPKRGVYLQQKQRFEIADI